MFAHYVHPHALKEICVTSRYIVVGSGSHEAAALVLDQLATAFGASSSVARVPAFAGTDADSAALGAASWEPDPTTM